MTRQRGHDLDAMPEAQARAILAAIEQLRAAGIRAIWHPNACGCCVSVHADVERPSGGYVIGPDGEGGTEWLLRVE